MKYKVIDFNTWPRKENFIYFTKYSPCKISMTADIDITLLKEQIDGNKLRFYPTFAFVVSSVLNKHDEFKTYLNQDNELIVYDKIHPRYPIFHKEDERLSILWSKFSSDFKEFYNNFTADCKTYGENRSMAAKGVYPKNIFDITSILWVNFTNFNYEEKIKGISAPFVAFGKFIEKNKKVILPLSVSVHHALCDGFHVGRFFEEVQLFVNEVRLN